MRPLKMQVVFFVVSLLHLRFIFACLPDFYLFKLVDFKATASRPLNCIFKRGSVRARSTFPILACIVSMRALLSIVRSNSVRSNAFRRPLLLNKNA